MPSDKPAFLFYLLRGTFHDIFSYEPLLEAEVLGNTADEARLQRGWFPNLCFASKNGSITISVQEFIISYGAYLLKEASYHKFDCGSVALYISATCARIQTQSANSA